MRKGPALLLSLLLPLLLLFGCTYTTTKEKAPIFAGSTDSLKAGLSAMFVFEHINVDGRDVTANGVRRSELEIDVINAKGLPDTKEGRGVLAHSIAAEFKKFLKDPKEYDTYTVYFIEQAIIAGVTTRKWKSHTFKLNEL